MSRDEVESRMLEMGFERFENPPVGGWFGYYDEASQVYTRQGWDLVCGLGYYVIIQFDSNLFSRAEGFQQEHGCL